jgi:hypothetical protein
LPPRRDPDGRASAAREIVAPRKLRLIGLRRNEKTLLSLDVHDFIDRDWSDEEGC